MHCLSAHFPSEWCFCETEVLLRTPKRPRQPLWEALALDKALGGCEKLMKVGYLASREVSCARGRMQQLKDCNYSIMVEFDWIRSTATGWDQDRRPGNGHGLDIISLSWQLKTSSVNTLLLLLHFPQYSRSGRCWCTGEITVVQECDYSTNTYKQTSKKNKKSIWKQVCMQTNKQMCCHAVLHMENNSFTLNTQAHRHA